MISVLNPKYKQNHARMKLLHELFSITIWSFLFVWKIFKQVIAFEIVRPYCRYDNFFYVAISPSNLHEYEIEVRQLVTYRITCLAMGYFLKFECVLYSFVHVVRSRE